ncbi:MAG: HlyD family efflux transporter periplasmic adaptor subunit, partial [Planctomycetota bacterium]
ASEAPGIIRSVQVSPGEMVGLGQTILKLNQDVFEAEYKASVSELEITELEARNDVNLRYAKKSLEVNQALLSRSEMARKTYAKSISRTDVERLELELEQAKLSAEQAALEADILTAKTKLQRNRMEISKINLDNRAIQSPIDGRVEEIYVQVGQWVNAGQKVARVIDPQHLQAKTLFDKKWIHKIKIGDPAQFSSEIGGQKVTVEGVVSYIGSVITPNQTFAVWVDVDNAQFKLFPGSLGKLTIQLQ